MRRTLLAALFLLVASGGLGGPPPASAQSKAVPEATAGLLEYRGFNADVSDISTLPNRAEILAALRRQFDICLGAGLGPDTLSFFQSVPLALKVKEKGDAGSPGLYNGRGAILRPLVYESDRPILLHEYMHAYHHKLLPGGNANPDVLAFYRRARDTAGMYPAGSYMLSNVNEYFAMTASVFLHGSAARDPYTRATLKAKQPLYFGWLEKQFAPAALEATGQEGEARRVVTEFGKVLGQVSVLAPRLTAAATIERVYAPFIAGDLLARWKRAPDKAPGKTTSSPSPERIDITSVTASVPDGFVVTGTVIMLTAKERRDGGVFASNPVTLTLAHRKGRLLITSYDEKQGS